MKKILFIDQKYFSFEVEFHCRNDCVYAVRWLESSRTGEDQQQAVIVWLGVSMNDLTCPIIFKSGVKLSRANSTLVALLLYAQAKDQHHAAYSLEINDTV